MAEVKITDLPVISESDFTANDRFLIIDDGNARLLTQSVFQSWLVKRVKGERGEQGLTGNDGTRGADGRDGRDGRDGLDAYQLAVSRGFSGTQSQWELSLKGKKGDKGVDGLNGWSPKFRTTPRGSDLVLELYDWVGGSGAKPTNTGYLSDTGIVTNIANATNIRGSKGDKGDTGADGAKGRDGADGVGSKVISDVSVNQDSSIRLTYTDDTFIESNALERVTGWGSYKDGEYTAQNPFVVATGTQITIPNNSVSKVENLPKGYSSLFNVVTQKYLMKEVDGFYQVRVKFKVLESSPSSFINVSMNGGTSDILYSEDRPLRGDNQSQSLSFTTEIYGGQALANNGLSIDVKTYNRAVSIHSIEVTIAKLI